MTLDEAIQHAKFQAAALGCNECGKEHEQLSKWLEELKEYKKDKEDNFQKLKRIYELILQYEVQYGRPTALETIEVSNKVRKITTIDELLEDLENNK